MIFLPSQYPISFILPIYNVEKYLSQAMESILQQDVNKEIILVDDGSTDNSLQIALDYANRYPFISVIHSHNKGVSAARNKGLALARGEYVLFLDPDDLLDKNADFHRTYTLAKQHNIQVVKGQFVSFYNETPNQIYVREPLFDSVKNGQARVTTLNEFLQKMLEINWFIQGANFLFKREFLVENNLHYDERLHFGEDGIFLTTVLTHQGNVMEVPFKFMNYRLHQESTLTQPISEKRLHSEELSLQILMEKMAHCDNENLKRTLTGILAMFIFFLHRDIKETTDPYLLEKYKNAVTPDMIKLYQSWGIGFSKIQAEQN